MAHACYWWLAQCGLPVVQVTQVHCVADIVFRHLLMLVLSSGNETMCHIVSL